jgi:hypothetical protein
MCQRDIIITITQMKLASNRAERYFPTGGSHMFLVEVLPDQNLPSSPARVVLTKTEYWFPTLSFGELGVLGIFPVYLSHKSSGMAL